MPLTLQITLIVISIAVLLFVLRKIRKSQLQIQNAIIWIVGSLFLLAISIFAPIMAFFAQKLGFMSTSNFVLVSVIFFLLIIVFNQDIRISILDEKLKNLNQEVSLNEHEDRNNKGEKHVG